MQVRAGTKNTVSWGGGTRAGPAEPRCKAKTHGSTSLGPHPFSLLFCDPFHLYSICFLSFVKELSVVEHVLPSSLPPVRS